ncbi:hypothetical protein Pmani_000651 [Petrolisthes manimaculis]|uniref:Uncharacterized protein n=1 Tax=Petrolisthes manimaculis TaxID=1843537 RepID=A0AAE1QL79_9EUCA|nr:hypothetical protein Pmani_000651 [Petrolisthes manimaculis]
MVLLGSRGLGALRVAEGLHKNPPGPFCYVLCKLILQHNMATSVKVNLDAHPQGVILACLWHFVHQLPRPLISNDLDWVEADDNLWIGDMNGEALCTQALLNMRPRERLLLTSLLFMVKQGLDVELRACKTSLKNVDLQSRKVVWYLSKAMLWTPLRSRRLRVTRVLNQLVRHPWLMSEAVLVSVSSHPVLTACLPAHHQQQQQREGELEVMAVAGEDAGVTLVAYRSSRVPPTTTTTPPTPTSTHHHLPPTPPARPTPRPTPRRSLSRLLGRCAESEDLVEQQQQQQQHQGEEGEGEVPGGRDSPPRARLARKVRLVGFQRSHSFSVQPAGSRTLGCRSSSGSRAGREDGHEFHTLKTSREVKMERARARARSQTGWDEEGVIGLVRESQQRLANLLEERGFIPPPAGFGAPTRPSSLLAGLTCGSTSLDEAALSPAARRRAAYTARRGATPSRRNHSSQESGVAADAEDSPPESSDQGREEEEEEEEEDDEAGCDLPSSPLSPPSPFHHPFFRRQLGLPTPSSDPWARLSGFGLPCLPQVLLAHAQRQQQAAAAARGEEWSGERRQDNQGSSGAEEDGSHPPTSPGRGPYRVTSSRSVVRYCSDSNTYNTRVMPPHLSRHLPPTCHVPTSVPRAPVRSERQHRNACRWECLPL